MRFAGVEITPDVPALPGRAPGERGVRVQLTGVASAETMEMDTAYLKAMEAWGDDLKLRGKDSAGRPPAMPGETVLSAVQAVITDNHDTDYRCVAGQVAGTGSEWDGSWVFVPEPPGQVNHLTIEFTLKGVPTGKSCRVQLH